MKSDCLYLYKVVILIVLLIVMTACSKSSDTTEDTKGNISNGNVEFEMPDAMGEITDITGNQITLKEIKINTQNRNANGEQKRRANGAPDERQGQGGERTRMTPPPDFDREAMPTRAPTEYTGKTLEIIIPTGVKVTQRSMGEDGNSTTEEVNISKLKNGDVLSIRYASDGKTVESASLSSGMRNFNRGGDGGPNGNGEFNGNGESRIITNDGA